jgi:hypothetical protein
VERTDKKSPNNLLVIHTWPGSWACNGHVGLETMALRLQPRFLILITIRVDRQVLTSHQPSWARQQEHHQSSGSRVVNCEPRKSKFRRCPFCRVRHVYGTQCDITVFQRNRRTSDGRCKRPTTEQPRSSHCQLKRRPGAIILLLCLTRFFSREGMNEA